MCFLIMGACIRNESQIVYMCVFSSFLLSVFDLIGY